MLGTLVRARDEGLPACAVCFSPWTDLAGTGESLVTNNGRCAMFRRQNVSEFARIYLGDVSPEARLALGHAAAFMSDPPTAHRRP